MLCTFNIPFGRYRFTRISFGISGIKNEEAFSGINGIHIVADYIKIAATTEKQWYRPNRLLGIAYLFEWKGVYPILMQMKM